MYYIHNLWWLQIFFIFTPVWRRFPIWVETTKQIGSQVLQASFWKAKRLKDESDPNWERSEKLSPSNRDPVLMTFAEKKDGFFAVSLRWWLRWITSKTTEIYRWWCDSDDIFLYLQPQQISGCMMLFEKHFCQVGWKQPIGSCLFLRGEEAIWSHLRSWERLMPFFAWNPKPFLLVK